MGGFSDLCENYKFFTIQNACAKIKKGAFYKRILAG